jgi:hypothetical protein
MSGTEQKIGRRMHVTLGQLDQEEEIDFPMRENEQNWTLCSDLKSE